MNVSLISDGSDPIAHLRNHMAKIAAPPFSGIWGTVDLQPDLFSPQRFCVGVVVAPSGEGPIEFRLISDATKFECVYDRAVASRLRLLLESAEQSLHRAARVACRFDAIEFGSDNLCITGPFPTSGASQEAVVARLFSEVVAMEPSQQDRAQADFISIDTEQVRLLVANEMKRIGGTLYERVAVSEAERLIVDETGTTHELDLNLRTATGVGSVVSAVFRTPNAIELNVLRSSRDLAAYARIRRVSNVAMFIMSAQRDQFAPTEYERISDLLDEQSWRLEKQGFRVTTFDDPKAIATDILEWADLGD